MRRIVHRSLTVAALIALPLAAQMASRAVPAAAAPASAGTPLQKSTKISISTLYLIERTCDDKLRGIGEPNTVDLLGATRGVYLDGYGTVFSAEMSLVTPPAIYPFHPAATKDDIVQVHTKKVQRLPLLRTAMKQMMQAAANSLAAMPDTQQIVLSVRLDNMKWEDTTGLPGAILIKADRKSALAGIFQIEEE
jgi:hypothetical protein